MAQNTRKYSIVSSSCCRRPHGDTQDRENGPLYNHCAAEGHTVTQKPENGPWCHHHAEGGLAVTNETGKFSMVSPLCCRRPHGCAKDQKMVNGVTIVVEGLVMTQKTREWSMVSPSCCVRPRGETKHQKIALHALSSKVFACICV